MVYIKMIRFTRDCELIMMGHPSIIKDGWKMVSYKAGDEADWLYVLTENGTYNLSNKAGYINDVPADLIEIVPQEMKPGYKEINLGGLRASGVYLGPNFLYMQHVTGSG
jgi:hypothetical protein